MTADPAEALKLNEGEEKVTDAVMVGVTVTAAVVALTVPPAALLLVLFVDATAAAALLTATSEPPHADKLPMRE